jgi:phosphohistidine phosphatase SixA
MNHEPSINTAMQSLNSLNSTSKPDYGSTAATLLCDDENLGFGDIHSIDGEEQNENREEENHEEDRIALKLFWLCGFVMLILISTKSTYEGAPIGVRQLGKPNKLCDCINDDVSPCKSLMLLRHAKSSWKNSYFVDDINRHLSTKGIAVAHEVGKDLHHMNLKLPELVLSSPSTRTEETLNIVLGEWILGSLSHDHKNAKEINVKNLSRQHTNKKLETKLKEKKVEVQYLDVLYTSADEGYMPHLTSMIEHGGSPNRVLIVGHNPAIEKLLNGVTSTAQQQFAAGQLYDICFPGLSTWNDLNQAGLQKSGVTSLVLPHKS